MGVMPGGMGGMPGGRARTKQERHIEKLKITLEDVFTGIDTVKTLQFSTTCKTCEGMGGAEVEECNQCKGRGIQIHMQQIRPGFVSQSQVPCGSCNGKVKICKKNSICSGCDGKKKIEQNKSINLKFPPGIRENDAHQFEFDDIIFIYAVEIEDHDSFKRSGDDLIYSKDISLSDALTGVHFNLKLLNGKTIPICSPEGLVIQPYTNHAVEGLGLPNRETKHAGNLIIEFNMIFPTKISKDRLPFIRKLLSKNSQEYKEPVYTDTNPPHYFKEVYKPNQSNPKQPKSKNIYEPDEEGGGEGPGVQCAQQ
jgi:DnaJ-class molecular chaperone